MAFVVKDRVQETTTTTGTGTVTLGGAVLGYQTFAIIGNGNTTYYAIADQATGDWEVGIGTYTASGTTLSRTTVLESSNSGSLVNFAAGSKNVFCTYPAERAVYLDSAGSAVTTLDIGTLGASTANITTANITSGTVSTTPTNNTDIVNKAYADAIASGINFHEAVELATTAALPSNTYNNGTSGVGATLTATANGALSVDSTLTVTSNRILVKNEATQANNGVYTVTQVGTAGTPYILTRATDFNTVGTGVNQIDEGDFFLVTSGTANANTAWVQQTAPPITIGTTALVFQQFSAPITYTAGTGLSESPSYTFNIANVGTAGTYGSASSVPVFTTNAQGQVTGVTPTGIAIASGAVSGLAASATTDTTNANNITSGTLGTSRLSGSYTGITGVGTLTAGTWTASTIGVVYGGTGLTSYAVGDLLYADTTTSLAKLADVATGNALISGGVSSAPSWGKIGLATHVSGTLPIANGGTGSTSTQFVALGTNVSGTLPVANGGTGQTTYTDGQLLIGNTTGNTLTKATLTQGTGITITNGNGSITIASTVSGTVTSVGATAPVASSGGTTPAISLNAAYGDTLNPYASKTANYFLAAPNGSAGAPTFRAVVAQDIPTLNQSTTGSAATLTTPRAIYGNNFDGSAALTQIIASTYGGTGNGFTKFSGPATAERTFTLPNSDATLLYSGGPLGTPSSGVATNLTGTASGLSIGGNAANVTGTVAIANGGTGQTAKTAAFDALSPSTTKGDLIAYDGTDNVRFAAGSNGYVLTADSTQASGLSWTAVSGTGTVTSVAATVPSFLSVSGSPITAAGTLAITLATTPTNGQLLIGNGTGFAYSTLSAGSGITITNGAGSIEIASTGGGGGLTQAQALKLVSLRL